MFRLRTIAAMTAASFAVLAGLATAAQASPVTHHHGMPAITRMMRHDPSQTVWIDDENGVLTTPCPLTVGEGLALIGYGPQDGFYVVTNIHEVPNGLFHLGLAGPPLPFAPGQRHSGTFDFDTALSWA